MQIEHIGVVKCQQRFRYEAPRQGSIAPANEALIVLKDDKSFTEALNGLSEFEYIWVIYEFHLNQTWHPLVRPPSDDVGKLGVFATRSPHRPNRIGMSCVRLAEITKITLRIEKHDLLDGTPVLDIKPYIPYADSFPNASAGWVDRREEIEYKLSIDCLAARQMEWVKENAGWDLKNFLLIQLRTEPDNGVRKRIKHIKENSYVISYRTWRIEYQIDFEDCLVNIMCVSTGYEPSAFNFVSDDVFNDKEIHKLFVKKYPLI